MDVKAAFHSAIRTAERHTVAEFNTWPLLYQFEAYRLSHRSAKVLVKPDGFIRVHETEADGRFEHSFFLEVDRSSETQDALVSKAGCYLDYYRSGGFAIRNGAPRSAYKNYPFRVLMVFKTEERRNNTAERLLQSAPPVLTQVCLSTFQEVTADPLGAIWIRPSEYREVTKGAPFDPEQKRETRGYRRQTEREAFVERTASRHRILCGEPQRASE